ncbi:DNase I-like protein [Rhizophagus irregularis]|uniref:DNase I-like protein n=1 Tax=Rhizophagus irregularis TaxID=588596 RepID=A0A2N0S6R2_9GLOM|nr:DNase I-like protein [Rhizophagus irregularis]
MDVPIEIDEEDLTEQIYHTGAKYWYRENGRNKNFSYNIRVYFKNEKEQRAAIEKKITYGASTSTEDSMDAHHLEMEMQMKEITEGITKIDINKERYSTLARYARKTTTENKIVSSTGTGTIANNNNENDDKTTDMETTKENNMFKRIEENIANMKEDTATDTTTTSTSTGDDTTIISKEEINKNGLETENTEQENITNTTTEIQEKITTTTDTEMKKTTINQDTEKEDSTIITKNIGMNQEAIDMEDIMAVTDVTERVQKNNKYNKAFIDEGIEGEFRIDEDESKKNFENNKKRKKANKQTEKIYKSNNIKKEKNNIKIGCINVRGLNENKKQLEIKKLIENENWDIGLLTETKLTENKGKYLYHGWAGYETINNSFNENNSKGGIAIILKKNISDRRYKIEKIDGYAIKMDLLFRKQKNITLIGIYRPNDDLITTDIINNKLKNWIQEAYRLEQHIIIMGDLNEAADKAIKFKKLIGNIYNHDLYDVHEVLAGKDIMDTWKSGELSSRIDYIFCNEDLLKEIISHEILEIEEKITDHKAKRRLGRTS